MNLSKLTNPEPHGQELNLSGSGSSPSNFEVTEKRMEQKTLNTKQGPLEPNIMKGETNNIHVKITETLPKENGSVIHRSTSEYRALYNHLLNKFKAARDISRVFANYELHLKNVSKYQQLRNNMLIDILLFINNNESLQPSDYCNNQEMIKKLESVKKVDKKLSNFINQLIKLENEEDGTDNDHILQNFNDLIGIDDVLSSDLSIQEANIYPDNYHGNFDSYEIVKKNQCFNNEISSIAELQVLVQPESNEVDLEEDVPYVSRKRKSSSLTLGTKRNSKKSTTDAISLSPVNIMPRLELYETNNKRLKKK